MFIPSNSSVSTQMNRLRHFFQQTLDGNILHGLNVPPKPAIGWNTESSLTTISASAIAPGETKLIGSVPALFGPTELKRIVLSQVVCH